MRCKDCSQVRGYAYKRSYLQAELFGGAAADQDFSPRSAVDPVARRTMVTPSLMCALISAISALVSLGFSIAAERTATGATRTMALYACARSLALFVASIVPFVSGSVGWLLAVAWSMIIVQGLTCSVQGNGIEPDFVLSQRGAGLA
jgi:hypothetical protein